jgi:hypothetical protein
MGRPTSRLYVALCVLWVSPAAAPAIRVEAAGGAADARLVFARPGGQLYAADAAGRNVRVIATGTLPDGEGGTARLAPDGGGVVFLRGSGPGRSDAYLYDFGSGSERLLTSNLNAPLRFSPDSRFLLGRAGGRSGYALVELRSGARRAISGAIHQPSFAADSSSLFFDRQTGRAASGYARYDLYRYTIANRRSVRLTTDGRSLGPVAGPDRVAYSRVLRWYPDGPSTSVWTMLPSGAARRALVRVGAGSFGAVSPLAWGESGKRLVGTAASLVSSPPVAIDPASGAVRVLVRGAGSGYTLTEAVSKQADAVLVVLRREDTQTGTLASVPYGGGRPTVLARGVTFADWNR